MGQSLSLICLVTQVKLIGGHTWRHSARCGVVASVWVHHVHVIVIGHVEVLFAVHDRVCCILEGAVWLEHLTIVLIVVALRCVVLQAYGRCAALWSCQHLLGWILRLVWLCLSILRVLPGHIAEVGLVAVFGSTTWSIHWSAQIIAWPIVVQLTVASVLLHGHRLRCAW